MTALAIVVSLVLIVFNGGFVAVEFGLIGAKRAVVDARAADGKPAALAAQRMQSDVLTTLGGAQLGITVCSLAIGRLAEPAISALIESALEGLIEVPDTVLHSVGFGVALGAVAMVHMVLGEMVPKNLALIGPERTLFVLARPIAAYLVLARPVVRSLLAVSNGVLRALRVEPTTELSDTATPAELGLMVRDSYDEGHIAAGERELIERALRFGATTVSEVMAPAHEVAAVQLADTVADAEQQFARTGRSRLVVFGDSADDVRGMLHSNDLALASETGAVDLADADRRAAARPPIGRGLVRQMLRFEPLTTLDEALRRMQRTRIHLAVVANDSRRTLGVVTLDDVLRGLLDDPPAVGGGIGRDGAGGRVDGAGRDNASKDAM